jgi:hypothetical protein
VLVFGWELVQLQADIILQQLVLGKEWGQRLDLLVEVGVLDMLQQLPTLAKRFLVRLRQPLLHSGEQWVEHVELLLPAVVVLTGKASWIRKSVQACQGCWPPVDERLVRVSGEVVVAVQRTAALCPPGRGRGVVG